MKRELGTSGRRVFGRRASWAAGVATLVVITLAGCGLSVSDVLIPTLTTIFLDDFNGVLASGWEVDGSGDVPHSLTDRPGFLRIYPQTVSANSTETTPGVLARELDGNFVVTTRMQFDPLLDFQLAGLVVVDPDQNRLVTFGLVSASGVRGTFRGLLLRADRGPDAAPGRATASFSGDEVFLRLERSSNTYIGSYSTDGLTYTRVGSVSNDLPGSVEVGLGAIKGESCGDLCDQVIPADFDFFEVSIPVADTNN